MGIYKTIYVTQVDANLLKLPAQICNFPEVQNGLPLTPKQLLTKLPDLFNEHNIFATTSEYVVLWVLQQVRNNHWHKDHVDIIEVTASTSMKHTITGDGDFNEPWSDGFFNDRGPLLFD